MVVGALAPATQQAAETYWAAVGTSLPRPATNAVSPRSEQTATSRPRALYNEVMSDPPCTSLAARLRHEILLLEHERPDEPPDRPRMCPICWKLRNAVVES